MRHDVRWLVFIGSFRLRHSFVIRYWAFVIEIYQALASEHATAVLIDSRIVVFLACETARKLT